MTPAFDLFGNDTMQRSVLFAGDATLRLTIGRKWGPGPHACMIGCNPSVAGDKLDDPTVLWWTHWCQLFGYGSFTGVNLYPFITSSPAECRKLADWEATDDWWVRDALIYTNLSVVTDEAKRANTVFAGWGAIAWDDDWIEHVVEGIQTGVAPWPDLWCWGTTKSGAPTHPMARGKHRIAHDQRPILWRAA